MKKLMTGALLALVSAIGAVTATAGDCPNEAATSVPPELLDSKQEVRCGVGVSILGLELSVFGPTCPVARFLVPAHGECLGAQVEDYRCVPVGVLNVSYERCECEDVTAIGTGLLLPSCKCTPQTLSAGFVIDWGSVACASK